MAEAKTNLLNGGDGLTLMQIEAEIVAANLVLLAAELTHINDELSDAVQRQTTLAADNANALRALSEIGGSDAAPQAEAQRQEAINGIDKMLHENLKIIVDGREIDRPIPLFELTEIIQKKMQAGIMKGNSEI